MIIVDNIAENFQL
jgi:CTD small phosphatase-like protein 2